MVGSPEPAPPPGGSRRCVFSVLGAAAAAVATVLVLLLWENIQERKAEGLRYVFEVAPVTEDTVDPAEWGKNYPRQYDGYRRTVDVERTRHGGSEAFQKLDADPRWRVLFEGYPFGVDYREERGHAYMLSDQDQTERVKKFRQPGACLHCHSAVIPAYVQAGKRAGAATRGEQILRGFEIVCAVPYDEARPMVSHPVTCGDCHTPGSMQLRVTRPAFEAAIRELARSGSDLPALPSVARWRGNRKGDYDPNVQASRQEMRSLVCAQCHVEYYFKGPGKLLSYPWSSGLRADQIEDYYDQAGHVDWTHPRSGAPLLKAQHPEFELWNEGIHARSGVACADCHMPYRREGAVKVSDHHVRSPLLNVARACQTCHPCPESELRARAEAVQDRTKALLVRAEEAVLALVGAIQKAAGGGAEGDRLKAARKFHRKAQWRLDFVAAENSMGFHAPQEAARLLAEAIDYARQGQVAALELPAVPK